VFSHGAFCFGEANTVKRKHRPPFLASPLPV
jgi:hypothetical protein